MLTALSINDFAVRLASREPAPGGGSVAALSGLLGVCLLEMVLNLTVGRSEFMGQAELLATKQTELAALHSQVQELIDRDAMAFNTVIAAFALPKQTPEEKAARADAVQTAMKQAAEVPMETAIVCLQTLQIAGSLIGKINPHAASDLAVAALTSHTGIMGALLNTAINLPSLEDMVLVGSLENQMRAIRTAADEQLTTIRREIYEEQTFRLL